MVSGAISRPAENGQRRTIRHMDAWSSGAICATAIVTGTAFESII